MLQTAVRAFARGLPSRATAASAPRHLVAAAAVAPVLTAPPHIVRPYSIAEGEPTFNECTEMYFDQVCTAIAVCMHVCMVCTYFTVGSLSFFTILFILSKVGI